MTDVIKLSKKAFTWAVVTLTIVWSMGLAAVAAPLAAQAADCPELEPGDNIQFEGSKSVFVLNDLLERVAYPHVSYYETWNGGSFANVHVLPTSCGEVYPPATELPLSVNPAPGTLLVKTTSLPDVYAILPGNCRAHIASEAVAKALYGNNWGSKVVDMNDVWFASLSCVSDPITEAIPHEGMVISTEAGGTQYLVQDGMLHEVDGTVGYAQVVSEEVFNSYDVEAGSTVTPAEVRANPVQANFDGSGNGNGNGNQQAAGNLSVALSANTPASRNLPDGSQFNDMLVANFTASQEDVKLKGLTVTREGFLANTNITGVSVWDESGRRHGEVMTSFNSDNQVVVGFASDPILIAKGDTESVTVRFNFGSTASGGTVRATLSSASAVDTDADVSGSFPVRGNEMSTVDGSSSLSSVEVAAQAVGGNSASTDAGNVEIGQTKDIAKFKFTETTGKNDVQIEQLVFFFDGTMKDGDLSDLKVVAPDNTVLGTVSAVSDRYATVVFDQPFTVQSGDNEVLTLRATVNNGSGNYFRVGLQNDYDLLVKDKAESVYLLPSDGAGDWNAMYASDGYFKMKSGTLTVTKRSDSTSGNVSAGADNVVLASFDVRAVGEDIEVRKLGVEITTTAGSKDLSGNVKIMVGGKQVLSFSGDYSTSLYVDGSGSQRNLSQYFTVKSGETVKLEVVGNIDDNASSDTYTASVGNMYGKRLSTLDFSDNMPSSDAGSTSGNQLTVQSTSVTLVKDTSVGNSTLSKGANHVIGQFSVRAGNAEGICLTNVSLKFAAQNGVFNAPTDLQNLSVWLGDVQLGTTLGSVATSSNSFSGNLCLNANETQKLKVKADVNSASNGGPVSTTIDSFTYIGRSTNNSTSDTATDPVGQDMTLGSAQVLISAVNDSTTVSSIRLPGAQQQMGRWKIEAQNDTVAVKMITFQVRDDSYADDTSAGNFGDFSLYDAADLSTPLNASPVTYIAGSGNGYVRFQGLNLSVPANASKQLVLKSTVNGGDTMDRASINVFVVRSDSTTDMEIYDSAGAQLGVNAIDNPNSTSGSDSRFSTSTYYMFHNAAPSISKVSVGSSLDANSEAKLFSFTIANSGDREMRIASTTINVAASGMTADSSFTTGTIQTWKLYEANGAGGLGTLLASTSSCKLIGGSAGTGFASGCSINANAASGNTLNVTFGADQSTSDNWTSDYLTVSAGSSRTFVFVADTSAVTAGKTTGTVNVTAKLDGATGFDATADTNEDNWADGVVLYFYKQVVGGSENTDPHSASDSYDVTGDTLKLTL